MFINLKLLVKLYIFLIPLFFNLSCSAQKCNCTKEFLFVKTFIEKNYVGFSDKLKLIQPTFYQNKTKQLIFSTKTKKANENCLLIISQYLDLFKDNHIGIGANFDVTKTDSTFLLTKEFVYLSPQKIQGLQNSKKVEGIYLKNFDTAYTIALIKKETSITDYIGVIVDSKLPNWKRGMVKLEAKKINDSVLKGILYLRNHLPKVEWFYIGKNRLGGDLQREGNMPENLIYEPYRPVDAKKVSNKTFYIKISDFDASNAKNIDSVFSTYKQILDTIPNLILDLRDNGGGSDFSFYPILKYIYTNPVKNIGVDVLATEAVIKGWRDVLKDEDISEEAKNSISNMIELMESKKNSLVNIVPDEIDSNFSKLTYPKKVAILIDNRCASTTEQFLLFAKQSSKVILLGQNRQGTLDYSNVRQTSFYCMPYILRYSTTRSRRIDINQAIDNIGIKPSIYLPLNKDWIIESQKILEK